MHLIKDENGNPIPHGAGHDHGHEHCHDHGHEHCHDHGHEHCHECHDADDCSAEDRTQKETVALLAYMQQHNEQHAAELDQMAANLEKLGLMDAAKQIREGVSDFQKGNMRLSLALTLVKEHFKEA